MPPGRGERNGRSLEFEGATMLKFLIFLQSFVTDHVRRDDTGATAVEYGLLVTLIAVAIITIVTMVGIALAGKFQAVWNAL